MTTQNIIIRKPEMFAGQPEHLRVGESHAF